MYYRYPDGTGYESADSQPKGKEPCDLRPRNDGTYITGINGTWVMDIERVRQIKLDELYNEAERRIEVAIPLRTKLNHLATATLYLNHYRTGTITIDEITALDNLEALFNSAVIPIQTAEATIKAEVEAAPDPSLIDVANHLEWP